MTELIKVKGLKGKQNKKKWAKNIDISGLLQQKAIQHDEEIREKFRPELTLVNDNNVRPPLHPDRFKSTTTPKPKPTYDNRITRTLDLASLDDPWTAADSSRHRYKPSEIPAVIAPESGHSYNPREGDIQKLVARVVDYEQERVSVPKPKEVKELPEVSVRTRNKKKRARQLEERKREEEKEFRQQLHNIKHIKKALDQKEKKTEAGIKTKQIRKERLHQEALAGRPRLGKKLGKKVYKFREYIPEGEKVEKVSQVALNDELVRERFDSIYRRGTMEARNVKVHANKRKHIKVKERFHE